MADTTKELIKNLLGVFLQNSGLFNKSFSSLNTSLDQQNQMSKILQDVIHYQQNKSPLLQGIETFMNSLAMGLVRSANPNESAFGQAIMGGGGFETPQERIQDKLYKEATQTLQNINQNILTQTKVVSTGVDIAGKVQQQSWNEIFNPTKLQLLQQEISKNEKQIEEIIAQTENIKARTEHTKLSTAELNERIKEMKQLFPLKEEEYRQRIQSLLIKNRFMPDLYTSEVYKNLTQALRNLSYNDYLQILKDNAKYKLKTSKGEDKVKNLYRLVLATNEQLNKIIDKANEVSANKVTIEKDLEVKEKVLNDYVKNLGLKNYSELLSKPSDEVPDEIKNMVMDYYKKKSLKAGYDNELVNIKNKVNELRLEIYGYKKSIESLSGVDLTSGTNIPNIDSSYLFNYAKTH